MKTLRTVLSSLPLLTLVGCGCTGDEGGGFFAPERVQAVRVATNVLPIAVEPPDTPEEPTRIDVFFLIDDSGLAAAAGGGPAQAGMVYGDIAGQPGRNKQGVAIAIFENMVANLKADLLAANPGKSFDIAFGVGRYEDFGGSFRTTDQLARPFILNMPILRQDHAAFAGLIGPALLRIAPGLGSERTSSSVDSQTVIEALFQIGSGAGFDGNGNASTGDSGALGALATQTGPGTSGDVPAGAYNTNGNDEDGEPQFLTAGNAVASGNLGGVGWRPDALRYVIATSDISSVSPFPANQAIPASITSTAGVNYPRSAKAIPSQAFAGRTGTVAEQAAARYGELPAPVAPTGGATVQSAINALNALNVEVLSIGTPRTAPFPTKPNLPGALPPNVAAIPAPATPDPSPFTWMSAVAILTGADRPYPTEQSNVLPLVYNLATVFPQNGSVLPDVREDLVYRVGKALVLIPAPPPVDPPALTPAIYDFNLGVNVPGGSALALASVTAVDGDGAGAVIQVSGTTIRVTLPRYYVGSTPTTPCVRIDWLLQVSENVVDNLAKGDTWPFSITATAVSADNPPLSPTPAIAAKQASLLLNWPPAPPTDSPTAVITNHLAGCVIVRDVNHGTETSGGTCTCP